MIRALHIVAAPLLLVAGCMSGVSHLVHSSFEALHSSSILAIACVAHHQAEGRWPEQLQDLADLHELEAEFASLGYPEVLKAIEQAEFQPQPDGGLLVNFRYASPASESAPVRGSGVLRISPPGETVLIDWTFCAAARHDRMRMEINGVELAPATEPKDDAGSADQI